VYQWLRQKMEEAGRYSRTISPIDSKHVARWVWRKTLGLAQPNHNLKAEPSSNKLLLRANYISRDCWDGRSFSFGEEKHVWEGDWEANGTPSTFWLEHLHSFHWLRQDSVDLQDGLAWMLHWSKAHKNGSGWGSIPTAVRVVNWMRFFIEHNHFDQALEQSLFVQADCLHRNLERESSAHCLWESAKALLLVGYYFNGSKARAWRKDAGDMLAKQLERQFLSDGGHDQRSLMLQSLFIEDLLDLLSMLPEQEVLLPRIERMVLHALWFLSGMSHPDGGTCFFGDATQDVVPQPDEIFAYARRLNLPYELPLKDACFLGTESGLYRLVAGDWTLFAKVGELGSDGLFGYTHADTNAFELSWKTHRVMIDSGCGYYIPDQEHLRMRSTKAHNTIEIDNCNSSEVWGKHRLGRRARPLHTEFFPPEADENGTVALESSHDGYKHLPGFPIHWRRFEVSEKGVRLLDRVHGAGVHRLRGFYHFPTTEFSLDNDEGCITFPFGKVNIHVPDHLLQAKITRFWPSLGHAEPGVVIWWDLEEAELPREIETRIWIS